ncbi:MAG: cation:proton antiporter [Bacteroidales bacterium]|jgi:Kef-type K+ transport system membrane component KefB|nr:cation:proton antiporter [Bacteroidales bacterium]
MTTTIIITFCALLLIAYFFDLTAPYTRIPSVILLLMLGWFLRQISAFLPFDIPDLSEFLPLLGTIGLILIVLEGAIELEISSAKAGLIMRSILGAVIPMFGLAFVLAFTFQYLGGYSLKDSLLNAIPFCIISSAIAIPSVRNIRKIYKDFIVFESSISDIAGVVFFSFILQNDVFTGASVGYSFLQFLMIMLISFVATIILSFLLHKIDHHIKFIPIILLVILIYTVSEVFELPALIFIMIFGLFLGNFDRLKDSRILERFHLGQLHQESVKFREITSEGAFIVRSMFFLLFGYLMETREILNPGTFTWALGIAGLIYVVRAIQLKLSGIPLFPLLVIAPRGLITILLFLSITPQHLIGFINKSLLIQVIVLTSVVMMVGMLFVNSRRKEEATLPVEPRLLKAIEEIGESCELPEYSVSQKDNPKP